ncbi:MAG: TonB-dependent receptor, partial [Bacteroidales bacterium]|nr:TonB-dependent receptor [Bacteroidales bacterium]
MKKLFSLKVFIGILAFIPLTVFTQTDTVNTLEEVVVTGTKTSRLITKSPEMVQVITRSQINELKPSSTGEILEYFFGINVEGGTGSGLPNREIISMNGMPANYSLILIDGNRLLSEHIHTGQNINLISPESIERIEVLKGASSSQYGSDAMGGVINIITRKASEKPEAFLALKSGSYNTYSSSIGIATPINDKLKIAAFANWEQSDGYPITKPAHRVDQLGYVYQTFLANSEYRFSEKSVLNSSIFFSENRMAIREVPSYGRLTLPFFEYKRKISNNLDASIKFKYSDW